MIFQSCTAAAERWTSAATSAEFTDSRPSEERISIGADRLAEDDVAAVLQHHVHGDGGGAVLHQQEHHGLLGLVAHHGDALAQRGEEGVQRLAPLAWETRPKSLEESVRKLKIQTFL